MSCNFNNVLNGSTICNKFKFSMKLSRLKLIWQGSPRVVIKCMGSRGCDGVGRIPMTIRRRLSSAVSAAGQGQEQCILDSCSISPTCQEPRVIIVGAGMAGLSAAHRLTQCGIRNFVVLEAKERYIKPELLITYFFNIVIFYLLCPNKKPT